MGKTQKLPPALQAQERMYNNMLLSLDYYDKAHLATIFAGIAKKQKTDKKSDIAAANINSIIDCASRLKTAQITQPMPEVKTVAFELAIRSLEFLLLTDFAPKIEKP